MPRAGLFLLAFVLLTKPDGGPIWVNPGEVITLQRAVTPNWPAVCRTAVRVHDGAFCVREELADVVDRLTRND